MADRVRDRGKMSRGPREQLSRHSLDAPSLPVVDYEDDQSDKFAQQSAMMQPYSHNGQSCSPNQYPYLKPQSRHTGEGDFSEIALNQVRKKWSEIEPDIWCKIFYLEQGRQLAKMYITEWEITVDGSYEPFDGTRIGIGAFYNPEQSKRVNKIRNYIGKGVTVKRDARGNILATREGKNDIIVKGYNDPANHCLPAEVIELSGRLPFQKKIKIFDMEKFKRQIDIEMQRSATDTHRLKRLCVVSLSFINNTELDFDTPCWLCIVNIMALAALEHDDVRKQVEQKVTKLSFRDVEKEKAKENLKQKYERPHWSKLTSRQSIHGKDAPLRKTRQELRKAGGRVEDHMDYSWQGSVGKSHHFNIMAQLQEEYEYQEESISPRGSFKRSLHTGSPKSSQSTSNVRKEWAKLNAAIKLADNEEK